MRSLLAHVLTAVQPVDTEPTVYPEAVLVAKLWTILDASDSVVCGMIVSPI